jgi:cytochrome c-type biogenesis protein CcmH/NrfG
MTTGRRSLAILLTAALVAAGCSSDEQKFEEHHQRAVRYREQDSLDEALIELRTALAIQPQDAETNYQIAEVLRALRKPGKAIFYYQEARRLDPGRVDAYIAEAALVRVADP